MRHQAARRELFEDEALDIALTAECTGARPAPDLAKRGIDHGADPVGGPEVAGVLRPAPHCLETLHEVG
jgi:hypothetical protein